MTNWIQRITSGVSLVQVLLLCIRRRSILILIRLVSVCS